MPDAPGLVLEDPPCPLCGRRSYQPVLTDVRDRVTRKAGVFSLQACQGCGLVATWPRPSSEALGYYYQGVYSGGAGALARGAQTGRGGRLVARYRLRVLRRFTQLAADTRLLDVGCGYGTFLHEAQRASGCAATGIDIDPGSLAHARAHCPRVQFLQATLEDDGALAPETFDLVTMYESLEHHLDPLGALRAVHRLLKPGGTCLVEVPNFAGAWRHVFGGWWMPLLVPQHLHHYTPHTLKRMLEAAGFEVAAPARSMFFPTESTVSLGLWLNELLGRPLRQFKPRANRPDGWLLMLLLPLWWALVEIPVQALLMPWRRAGHQVIAGVRRK